MKASLFKKIGTLRATEFKKNGSISYHTDTRIRTKILLFKKVRVHHSYDVFFSNNGSLEKSKVVIDVNKNRHEVILTEKNGNGYQVTLVDEDSFPVSETIDHTTAMLYFNEPKSIKRTYSEQTGRFNELTDLKEGTYRKTNEKGRENIYHYKAGRLEKIEVDGGLVHFEIKAQ